MIFLGNKESRENNAREYSKGANKCMSDEYRNICLVENEEYFIDHIFTRLPLIIYSPCFCQSVLACGFNVTNMAKI